MMISIATVIRVRYQTGVTPVHPPDAERSI